MVRVLQVEVKDGLGRLAAPEQSVIRSLKRRQTFGGKGTFVHFTEGIFIATPLFSKFLPNRTLCASDRAQA